MGLGILLKQLAPLIIYLIGLGAAFLAVTGKPKWALLVVTVLLPLRNVVDRLHSLPLGTQFIDLLIASMLVGWCINSFSKGKKFNEHALVTIPAIIMIIYLTVSILRGGYYLYGGFSIDASDQRVQDWKNFCMLPMLFWITLNIIDSKKWVIYIFATMCITMVVMGYYSVNQVLWYSSLESRAKITSTFQFLGPNEVAAFLNQMTVILMGVYFYIKHKRNKMLLLGLILLNMFCIVFMYSRGAYAAFGVGMFILFILKNQKLLIPLILAVMFWQVVLPEKAVERIKETKGKHGQLDESSQRRVAIWDQALDIFSRNPVFGIGYGVFRHLGLDLGDTHNIYVKILVEQGVLGMGCFLLVIFSLMAMGFILYQKGDDEFAKGLGLGFAVCMVVLLINNIFGDRWTYFELSAYLWLMAGLVGRSIVIAKNPEPVVKKAAPIVEKIAVAKPPEPKLKKKIRYYDL